MFRCTSVLDLNDVKCINGTQPDVNVCRPMLVKLLYIPAVLCRYKSLKEAQQFEVLAEQFFCDLIHGQMETAVS